MEEKKTIPATEKEMQNEELKEITGGFGGFPAVPTVPVNPIDDELREDA